jgi:serine/threonine protein kinase
MDRDANERFDDAFEVGERIGAGGLGTVHACRARGNVNAKIPRGMPLVVKSVRVRLDAGGCVRANASTSGRVDAEIRALRRLDACAERDSNAASAMFPSLVAAFSGRPVEKRSHEDAARNDPSSAACVVMTNPSGPVGASSCDLLRLRAEARERRGDENAQFPESEARFYAAQIVVALRYLHARARLAHGDVKPENVLVRRGTGAVSLCDFDLARSLTEASPRESAFARGARVARSDDAADARARRGSGGAGRDERSGVVGTPEYVAPELARGAVAGATAQTDWYQLGVLAFELVFGRTPFAAPFGVVGMTLRAIEANDLRFFDALFAAADVRASGDASASAKTENRKRKRKETSTASVPFLRFTRALLEGDPGARLGDADVRRAEFFACVDWEALERGERGIAGRAARARGAREDWILFLSEENTLSSRKR